MNASLLAQNVTVPMTGSDKDPDLNPPVISFILRPVSFLCYLLGSTIERSKRKNRIAAMDEQGMSDEDMAQFLKIMPEWQNELHLSGGWLGALSFVLGMVHKNTPALVLLQLVGNTFCCIIMISVVFIMSIYYNWNFYYKEPGLESAQEVKNIFQDLSMPMVKVVLTFGGQTSLMGFLVYHFVTNLKWLDEYILFWCVGVIIVEAGRTSIGVPFTEEHKFWSWAFAHRENGFIRDKEILLEPQKSELLARFLMSAVSNDVYHYATIVALPFFVMTAETGIDFIKDVFAITFVINMDNFATTYMLEHRNLE